MTVKTEWQMVCPSCRSDEKISVEVKVYASLTAHGTDVDTTDHEWDDDSGAACECGRFSTVRDFKMAYYEDIATTAGWRHGGDCGGFWYDHDEFGSWKAAASADDAATYETAQEVCEAEGLLDEAESGQ